MFLDVGNIFNMIVSDRPMISFGAKEWENMLTFLELSGSNTAGTLLSLK
jgi:hypothetical protein